LHKWNIFSTIKSKFNDKKAEKFPPYNGLFHKNGLISTAELFLNLSREKGEKRAKMNIF